MFSHSTTLPAPHHTCSHPVCGHYEDTARGEERASSVQLQVFNSFWNKYYNTMCSTDAFRASSTWLESPMQVSGMSQSLTASRHVTPLSSYWPKKPQKEKREENKTEGQRVSLHKPRGTIWFKCWGCMQAAHLAVPAAQPIAAHGIVGKSTLLTTVCSFPCTFLQVRDGL